MEYLKAKYDKRKSFYNKAKVIREDNSIKLKSYDTIVAEIIGTILYIYGDYSQTTRRHQIEFIRQFTDLILESKDIFRREIYLY